MTDPVTAPDPVVAEKATARHGEGCGCYWCLPERPGISPPPTWAEVLRMERQVENGEWP